MNNIIILNRTQINQIERLNREIFGEIRVLKIDGELWRVTNDLLDFLLCQDDCTVTEYLAESGLYAFILRIKGLGNKTLLKELWKYLNSVGINTLEEAKAFDTRVVLDAGILGYTKEEIQSLKEESDIE